MKLLGPHRRAQTAVRPGVAAHDVPRRQMAKLVRGHGGTRGLIAAGAIVAVGREAGGHEELSGEAKLLQERRGHGGVVAVAVVKGKQQARLRLGPRALLQEAA